MVKMLEESVKQIYRHNDILSEYACHDLNAVYFNERKSNFLPPFYKDTEAIINSTSFTRYIGKPQVYIHNNNFGTIKV